MRLSRIMIPVASLCLLWAVNARAEHYHGVLQFQSGANRADVHAQALAASHLPDAFREGASAGVAPAAGGQIEKSEVRAQALAAARVGNPFGDSAGAGVASTSIGTVDRQAVRAEARATAARGVNKAIPSLGP
ncbi:hypothetical protein A8M77_12980 [Variovorax sp. JS1663]|nr:hypothetical protein A8M77_12980 [Variovorax sp. JS1663]